MDQLPPYIEHAALQLLPEAVILTDMERVIRFINPAAGRLFKVEPESVVGTSFLSLPGGNGLMTPEQVDERHKLLNKHGPTGIPVPPPYELRWITGGEGDRLFAFRSIPIWDAEQQERIGILIRIDERTLEVTAVDLLSIIGSEVRTPLTAIQGYADLLNAKAFGPLTEKQHEAVTSIKTNTVAVINVISQILDAFWERRQDLTDIS